MSEQLSFDRAKGFVALPVEVLEIDLSPGAFRLLVELCRMANADGFCWPSLDQLSDRLGRSRSAISGYIKSLRSAGLVSTQEQKTANGYNYRLKYEVTFWRDWRASLSRTRPTKTERSVQPTERLKESKKQSHINHITPMAKAVVDQLLETWKNCFQGAPYPSANIFPSQRLLAETDKILATPQCATFISADIIGTLRQLWTSLNVVCPNETIEKQSQWLMEQTFTNDECSALIIHISKAWEAHWRRPPTEDQFAKLVKSAKITTQGQKVALLKSYQKRWALAQKALRNSPVSDCLGATTPPAFRAVG